MTYYCLLTLALLSVVPNLSVQQQCNTASDLGRTDCVLLTPYYSEYQWATCLTEEYIMRSSNQRYQCRSSTVTQCWYQCTLEVTGRDQGEVEDECLCSPGEERTESPTDSLPPHCYSPRGDDCSWYRDCLEVRYPCEGTEDGYAIEYADKFCNLYSDNYNDFGVSARAWIDGVRKCLQVVLVPSLRPWVSKTCEDIRRDAFNSHPGCYINPGSGAPSICELPCADVWKSFWLVSYEGGALTSAPIETTRQMLSVMVGCYGSDQFSGCIPRSVQTGLTILTTVPAIAFAKRLTVAVKVVSSIAETLNWESNGFRWFTFPADDTDEDSDSLERRKREISQNVLQINVLLVDTKALNITNGTRVPTEGKQNLDQALDNFANVVRSGSLSEIPLVLNSSQVVLNVQSVGQCDDILCNSTNVTELAVAPDPPKEQPSGAKFFVPEQNAMVLTFVMIVLTYLCRQ